MDDDTLKRLAALFSGHEGVHGTHKAPTQKGVKWEIKGSAKTLNEPPTIEMWRQHVEGTRPLGIVPIREDSTCLWGSIDYDEYTPHADAVVDKVAKLKLPLLPTRSKSGGLHLFLFIDGPVAAAILIMVLRDLSAKLGVSGSEIFPKQTQIMAKRGDFGNWMCMPYLGTTFDGVLYEQVGIKPGGFEMVVEEYIARAEEIRLTAAAVTAMAQVAQGGPAARKVNGEASGGKIDRSRPVVAGSGPFSDGPPCLQHLAALGVEPGQQNNALLNFGIYCKKAYPDDWKAQLENINHTYLKPPGSAEGLVSVERSLDKKDYNYTCRTEPCVSHCNSAICRTRPHGVGKTDDFPQITSINKLDLEDPIWFVEVDDVRIEMSSETLLNYSRFQLAAMSRLNKVYAPMSQANWCIVLGVLMENAESEKPTPDMTAAGQFMELLEDFLTNRQAGRHIEDILTGRPWEDVENSRFLFQLRDLQTFVRREDVLGKDGRRMTRAEITGRLQKLGGGHEFRHIKTVGRNIWWVPSNVLQRLPDPEPPPPRHRDPM
jgi:hypothetical protein